MIEALPGLLLLTCLCAPALLIGMRLGWTWREKSNHYPFPAFLLPGWMIRFYQNIKYRLETLEDESL